MVLDTQAESRQGADDGRIRAGKIDLDPLSKIIDDNKAAEQAIYDRIEREAGAVEQDQTGVAGVWLPEDARAEKYEGIHGRVCTVRWAQKTWFTCTAELDGKATRVPTKYVFTAPDGAKLGDAFELEQGVTGGDTDGTATGEGYEVPFGGACPVQGDGIVDGFPCYYRSRGAGWSFTVYPPGTDDDDLETPAVWEHAEICYLWPDGGWVSTARSVACIERAVAKFRARAPW